MRKIILIILTVIATSFFFLSFCVYFLSNSKHKNDAWRFRCRNAVIQYCQGQNG